jgi:hypothetical protein
LSELTVEYSVLFLDLLVVQILEVFLDGPIDPEWEVNNEESEQQGQKCLQGIQRCLEVHTEIVIA